MISRSMFAIVSSICMSGCGTCFNLIDQGPIIVHGIELESTAPKKVYGGVSQDASFGRGWIEEGNLIPGLCVWFVDLPLSAVGDTLTLPITLRAALDRSIEDYYFRDARSDPRTDERVIQETSIIE